jgi:hypothetical protein
MANKKEKLTELELTIKHHIAPHIDYSYQRSVSYSQYSIWKTCPHQWYLSYVKGLNPYSDSIHTIFGTAMHETLQQYITTMYTESGAAADRLGLQEIFQEKFVKLYQDAYDKTKMHFSSAEEMREFFNDGVTILEWIRKKRNILFSLKNMKLLGIELPIINKVSNNLYLKGYIDFVLYDTNLDKIYIYDIKTSTRGWGDKDKKDDKKIAQILLYKEYFAKQYGVDVDKIEVEFFIVKRKIWEESEFPIPRVQEFKPASGKNKRSQVMNSFDEFLKDCFDNGKIIEKQYNKIVGEDSCKWCPYYNKPDLCDKIASL